MSSYAVGSARHQWPEEGKEYQPNTDTWICVVEVNRENTVFERSKEVIESALLVFLLK